MRGKRKPAAPPAKAPARKAKTTRKRSPPAPKAPPKPKLRNIADVPADEVIGAINRCANPSTAALELNVSLLEFNERLAEDEDLRKALRLARAAADEYRTTKLALAGPQAADYVVELAKSSSPADSVRIGAVQAVLLHAANARKADLAAIPAKKVEWPRPGPLPVRLVEAAPTDDGAEEAEAESDDP